MNKQKEFYEFYSLIKRAEIQDSETLHLTANENLISKVSEAFLNSTLANRYLLGHFSEQTLKKFNRKDDFIYKGIPELLKIFQRAEKIAKKLFWAEHVDFRPLSGINALMLAILATTNVGEKIWCLSPTAGGHFVTTSFLNATGRRVIHMPWDYKNMNIDLKGIRSLLPHNPAAIIFDYADPVFPLPIKELREILGEKPKFIYDASHVLGLIAGGLFQNPLAEGCDILVGSTHKTFPGPQKGILAFRNSELGQAVSQIITDALISTQHTHHTLALCLTFIEMESFGEAYAKDIIRNVRALAYKLVENHHSLLVPWEKIQTHSIYCSFNKINAEEASRRLLKANISVNARTAFNQGFVRFGLQEITRRGMSIDEIDIICFLIQEVLTKGDSINIQKQIQRLLKRFNKCLYSFDDQIGGL